MLGSIFRPLFWLKNYLSHVRETSWHYRFVYDLWGRNTQGKACTYYWFKLPSTFIVTVFVFTLVGFFSLLAWCFGFVPTWFETEDPFLKRYMLDRTEYRGEPSFYPYGYTSKGKKRHIYPWQLILIAGVVALVYYLAFVNTTFGVILGILLGGLLGGCVLLGITVFLIVQGWKTKAAKRAGSKLKVAWDKVCPPLIVVPSEPKENS